MTKKTLAITGTILGAMLLVAGGAYLAASDWDVEEPGRFELPQFEAESGSLELPEVDVRGGEFELPEVRNTNPGDVAIPTISVETPDIEVGTKPVEIPMPSIDVDLPEENELEEARDELREATERQGGQALQQD